MCFMLVSMFMVELVMAVIAASLELDELIG
jgi:hypothetical protein